MPSQSDTDRDAVLKLPPTGEPTRHGDWDVGSLIAEGGMSRVYRARHAVTGAPAAFKRLRPGPDSYLYALRREVQLLAGLNHPDIVRVLDHDLTCAEPWIVLPWIDGWPLDTWRSTAGDATATLGAPPATASIVDMVDLPALSPPPARPRVAAPRDLLERLSLVVRLCTPLAWLHGEGLLHRDLKPANVIVTRDRRPMLLDFGVAHLRHTSTGRDTLETGAWRFSGTPTFAAPEQILGEPVDPRTDLYSLGCILHLLLVGRAPFEGSTASVLRAHVDQEPPGLDALVDGLPTALTALVARLLRKDPRERPASAIDVARALVAIGAAPDDAPRPTPRPHLLRRELVGREDTLARVGRTVDAGGVLVLHGPAGQGKTRLAREAARLARRDRRLVVVDVCEPGGAALHALQRACAAAGHPPGLNPELAGVLRHELGVITIRPAVGPPPPLSDDAARRRRIEAITRLLFTWAQEVRPVLLVDDIGWADDLSLAVLTRAAREPSLPLAIITTLRTGDETERHAPLLHTAEVLELGALDEASTGALIASNLGLDAPPHRLAAQLHARAEGNPLFVQELLGAALQSGALFRNADGRWALGDHDVRSPATLDLKHTPTSVTDLIGERLDRLSPGARLLLEATAVFGRTATDAAVAALGASSEHLPEVLRVHLVEPDGAGWCFPHGVQRDVVLARTDPRRLAKLHAHAAVFGEAHGGAPEVVAHHWLAAGRADLAVPWMERALSRALTQADHVAAARLAEQLSDHVAAPRAAGTLALACRCWRHAGDTAAINRLSPRAVALIARHGAEGALAELYEVLASSNLYGRGPAVSLTWADEALRVALPTQRTPLRALRVSLLAVLGDRDQAIEELVAVLPAVEAMAPGAERDRALNRAAHAAQFSGRMDIAEPLLLRLVAEATTDSVRMSAVGNLGILYYVQGDLPASERCIREALSLARRLHDDDDVMRHLGNLAELMVEFGRLVEAREAAAEAARAARLLGHPVATAQYTWIWSRASRLLGDPTGPLRDALRAALDPLDHESPVLRLRPLIELALLTLAEGGTPALDPSVERLLQELGSADPTPMGKAAARLLASLQAHADGLQLVHGEAPGVWTPALRATMGY